MAKTKPCAICGGEKSPVRGARYCDVCRAATNAEVAKRASEQKSKRLMDEREQRRIAEGRPMRVSKAKWPEGQKWCARCERFLPIDKFPRRAGNKPAPYCPPCQKSYNHEVRIKKIFGITAEQYAAMLVAQDGRCAICQNRPRKYRLAVDHDHKTGAIRGLLCVRCNRDILGAAHDNVDILRRAVAYMEAPPADAALGLSEPIIVRGHDAFDDLIDRALQQSEREQANAGTPHGVAFIRRPGGRWFAAMTLEQWCSVARETL